MLTYDQLTLLTPEERLFYATMQDEDKESFEYFYGYAHGTAEKVVITNREAQLYRDTTDKITLKAVCELVGFIPHSGQQNIFYTLDNKLDTINSLVIAAGRRFGKSKSVSIIALRELLVPHSATVLIAPTFANAKIIFNEVLKFVHQLQLPIESINKGQFNFTLSQGARFTANSEMNIESALGGNFSLALYEEFSTISTGANIHQQMIAPTMLDFGTRPSGILYARQLFIGTSRGKDNQLYDYFLKEEKFSNWKSFTAPSSTNPTLPKSYFDQLLQELGDMLYRQEIMAEFMGSDKNVFHAFNKIANTYSNEPIPRDIPEGKSSMNYFTPNSNSVYVCGIDIGWSDSTTNVFIYRTPNGFYYVQEAYSQSNTATADHIKAYEAIEAKLAGTVDIRFCDPAAAQTINDYIITYNYDVVGAKNDVKDSLQYINQLFSATGANHIPRLYIHEDLKELIRQIQRVNFRSVTSKTSSDPFVKDPAGTHWDLISALRYALYSDRYNMASINVVTSSKKGKYEI